MAFTAVRYPMDKDQGQLPFWSDNDELVITGDNFFDQFVTFDAGDVPAMNDEIPEDPPSPSILLDSLKQESIDSPPSYQIDSSLPGDAQDEISTTPAAAAAASDFLTIEDQGPSSADQTHSSFGFFPGLVADPILSNGSISDSELLRLEGISLKSPRGGLTAPSTPPFGTSASLSPEKHSKFVESVYATVRRGRPKHSREHDQYQGLDMTTLDAFLSNPQAAGLNLFDSGLDDFTGPTIKREPVDCHGLPLSPPLTGRIPDEQRSGSQSHFVTGHIEDPFCEDILTSSPAIVHHQVSGHNLNTPMNTPMLGEDAFFNAQDAIPAVDANMSSYRTTQPNKPLRNGSSAEWPMDDLLNITDGKFSDDASALWPSSSSSAAYVTTAAPSNNGPEWWETAATGGDMAGVTQQQQSADGGGSSSIVHSNAAHNMTMHNQQAELPYEYYSEISNSGLMIHMPQPRAPQASVLSANLNDLSSSSSLPVAPGTPAAANGTASVVYSTPHRQQQQQQQYHHQRTPSSRGPSTPHHPHHHHNQHYHTEHRRPRPRAPSSGARYHHHQSHAMTSPRKMPHHPHHGGSSSRAYHHLREESVSPSPIRGGPPHYHPHHSGVRSSSLSMRKRRSFSRRAQAAAAAEPRTPSFASSSSLPGGDLGSDIGEGGGCGGVRSTSMSSGGGGGGGGGGAGGIDFVNFTANDKNVLMTGVAPSGSSKTKARREKEALEKSRRISEAAFRAVQDAGGDVNKLHLMSEFPI